MTRRSPQLPPIHLLQTGATEHTYSLHRAVFVLCSRFIVLSTTLYRTCLVNQGGNVDLRRIRWIGMLCASLAIAVVSIPGASFAEQPSAESARNAIAATDSATAQQNTHPSPSTGLPEAPDTPEAITPLATGQGCFAKKICLYTKANFGGIRHVFTCKYGEVGGDYHRSARNRCANRSNFLNVGLSILVCMNPGGNRPNPGLFTSTLIRGLGTRC